jgi:hypothetical protein
MGKLYRLHEKGLEVGVRKRDSAARSCVWSEL